MQHWWEASDPTTLLVLQVPIADLCGNQVTSGGIRTQLVPKLILLHSPNTDWEQEPGLFGLLVE